MMKVKILYLHLKELQTQICLIVKNTKEKQQICNTGLLYQDSINQHGGHRTFPVKCNTSFSPKCSLRFTYFRLSSHRTKLKTHKWSMFFTPGSVYSGGYSENDYICLVLSAEHSPICCCVQPA